MLQLFGAGWFFAPSHSSSQLEVLPLFSVKLRAVCCRVMEGPFAVEAAVAGSAADGGDAGATVELDCRTDTSPGVAIGAVSEVLTAGALLGATEAVRGIGAVAALTVAG